MMDFKYIDITFLLFFNKEEPDCTSEPWTGPCRENKTRFYFDNYDNKCKKFTYGGCQGNDNNYKTKAECSGTCFKKGNL